MASGYAMRRMAVVGLFAAALVGSVGLWWTNTPSGSIADPTAIVLAAGRITGLVSGFILLVEIVTMSRIPLFERWFGSKDLLVWHRSLGGALVVLAISHAVLLIVAYARASSRPLPAQTWNMITTLEDMVSATIATGILVAAGLLSLRALRRRMPYELWHATHLGLYLVIPLIYGHQFALGFAVIKPGPAQWYWAALHIAVGLGLVWGRLVRPVRFNARHRFEVSNVVAESPDWVSIYLTGRDLASIDVRAGQYFRWRFLTRQCWWQSHPFSISAAPNGGWLRVSVKSIGDHTSALRQIKPGVRVLLSEPAGCFTADRRATERAVLVAGGGGIAPIMSLLEELPADTVVLYRAHSTEDMVFRAELEQLAAERGTRVVPILGSRTEPLPRRAFTPRGLRELVPDIAERDAYLCGPTPLIETAVRSLRRIGLPGRQIHLDPFEF